MSLTLIHDSLGLRILEGELPAGTPVRVFTEDELPQFEGWRHWSSLSKEQRESFLLQTQSREYQDWMDEEDWPEARVGEPGQEPYGGSVRERG